MTHLRERWEGVSLCGKYTLQQWLGGDDRAAFFQTSLAPDERRAVVKLAPDAAADDAGPLNLWHRIRQLRHPNLVELLDCGRADLDGEIAFYAIFESPDDTLTSALSRGPLNAEESREILVSVIDALRYLHAQGLAAGALDPDHIVAIGDQVKLSTGALREAEASSAYREDVRLLGELWQRHLMPASPKSAEISAHAADPDAETRWTLAEIRAALAAGGQAEPVPPTPTPAEPLHLESPVADSVAPVAPVSEAKVPEPPLSLPPVPVRETTPAVAPPHGRGLGSTTSFVFPKWVLIGAPSLVLLFLGLNLLRPAKVATQSKMTPVSLPVQSAPPAQAPLPEIVPPNPAVETAPKPARDDGPKIWRVIAFTYRTREAASTKAHQLNEYHPGIEAAVFSPNDDGRYYLVSLGGRMSREDAERLQRTARGRGLPHDLYVQNYTR